MTGPAGAQRLRDETGQEIIEMTVTIKAKALEAFVADIFAAAGCSTEEGGRKRRRTPRLFLVRKRRSEESSVGAKETQWFGFPVGRTMPDPGQRSERGLFSCDEVGERPTGEVRR